LKTEDGIQIRKLFIKIFDSSISIDEVKSLLSIYGEIEEIQINVGKHRMRNRGFVTYKTCYDATRALVSRKNFIEFFELKPSDTWLQPDFNSCENYTHDSSDCENSEILSSLDDDCLLHIMSFLDPLDVFTLRKVCEKFQELADFYFRSIRSLDFMQMKEKKKISLLEAKMICEKVGRNVKKLSIDSEKFNNQRILNFVPHYFRNLQVLKLTGFKLDSKIFWDQMKKILMNLIELNLSDNSLIYENFLKCSPRKLKILNLSNTNVCGDFLEYAKLVEILNLSGCRNIHGRHLLPFIVENKNLKSLNIGKCVNMYGLAVNEILIHAQKQLVCLTLNNYFIDENTSRFIIPNINVLTNLRELTIQNINYPPCDQLLRTINLDNLIETLNISYGNLTLTTIYAISTMKYLKKLIMNFKTAVTDDLVDYLIDKEFLEELHIAGCDLSPASVLRLMDVKSLRFLDISRCYSFDNEFVVSLAKTFKNKQRQAYFTLHVGQTEIDQNIYENSLFQDIGGFLHLSFEVTKDLEHDYDIDEENNKTQQDVPLDCYNIDGIFLILL
jgi:F-box domain/RNA recognition motif. (a.k.a. RRM, RBD, or RNP domain)